MKDHLDADRDVLGDNFFISFDLIQELAPRKTTYLRTVRRNKLNLPDDAKNITDRQHGGARHFYSTEPTGATLCALLFFSCLTCTAHKRIHALSIVTVSLQLYATKI